ncbi:MAG: recombinase family protein [Bacteroidota bacterium]
MKVLYVRTSIADGNTSRQRVNETEYDYVVEDKLSGATEFALRPGGSQVIELLNKGQITELGVWQIDRLGRNMLDILQTIHRFTEKGIPIYFISQGLRTLMKMGLKTQFQNSSSVFLGL